MTVKIKEKDEIATGKNFGTSVVDHDGVERLLTGFDYRQAATVVDINGIKVGGGDIVVMAGPCAVESAEQILRIAREIKKAGATVLRGGAFKPRTSPYDFQGLGKVGLECLRMAAMETWLRVVTEVLDPGHVELVAEYADCLQIGSRNMHNFSLLREVGRSSKPVLLKRGLSASYKEFLMAAEYIMSEGNEQVILCERGIRGITSELRFTLDLAAVPYLRARTHLPVMVDPSHGTGDAGLVPAMSRAAVACGVDGIIVETHYSPRDSVSDAYQTISTSDLRTLVDDIRAVAKAVGKDVLLP
jgi:3-deoxy-7-phosphoheptulonate synthase